MNHTPQIIYSAYNTDGFHFSHRPLSLFHQLAHLSDIERGDKAPKLEAFIQIVNTLSASADDVLQDSLIIGCEAKSNDLLKKLETLDDAQRKQALAIFDSVIAILQGNEKE